MAERLEALRFTLHRRLDELDRLVRAGGDGEADIQVQSLLEQLQVAEQWKQQHLEEVAQLEEERAQLAEAWERLERERTRTTSQSSGSPGAARAESPALPPSGFIPKEMENPVSRALLHQFKEFQGDVKRHAENPEDRTVV